MRRFRKNRLVLKLISINFISIILIKYIWILLLFWRLLILNYFFVVNIIKFFGLKVLAVIVVINLLIRLILIQIRYLLVFSLHKSLRGTNYAFNHRNCFIMNLIFFGFLILLICRQLHSFKLIFYLMKFLIILSRIIFSKIDTTINTR